ncbi:MAG: NADase-type glycan-binding domain-containing protein [Polyangiales bacterium]
MSAWDTIVSILGLCVGVALLIEGWRIFRFVVALLTGIFGAMAGALVFGFFGAASTHGGQGLDAMLNALAGGVLAALAGAAVSFVIAAALAWNFQRGFAALSVAALVLTSVALIVGTLTKGAWSPATVVGMICGGIAAVLVVKYYDRAAAAVCAYLAVGAFDVHGFDWHRVSRSVDSSSPFAMLDSLGRAFHQLVAEAGRTLATRVLMTLAFIVFAVWFRSVAWVDGARPQDARLDPRWRAAVYTAFLTLGVSELLSAMVGVTATVGAFDRLAFPVIVIGVYMFQQARWGRALPAEARVQVHALHATTGLFAFPVASAVVLLVLVDGPRRLLGGAGALEAGAFVDATTRALLPSAVPTSLFMARWAFVLAVAPLIAGWALRQVGAAPATAAPSLVPFSEPREAVRVVGRVEPAIMATPPFAHANVAGTSAVDEILGDARRKAEPPRGPMDPARRRKLQIALGVLGAVVVVGAVATFAFKRASESSDETLRKADEASGADAPKTIAPRASTAALGTSSGTAAATSPSAPPAVLVQIEPQSSAASTFWSKGGEQHPASQAFDGKLSTAWCSTPGKYKHGEWIEARLPEARTIGKVVLSTGFDLKINEGRTDLFTENAHVRTVSVAFDGGAEETRSVDKATRQLVIAPLAKTATVVRFTVDDVWSDDDSAQQSLCLSEIAIYAQDGGSDSAGADNDGTDSARPTLAPADHGFVDSRGGWGWGDRCWLNIKAKKPGWAKAECQRGLAIASPTAPQPRASLMYNAGLIEKEAGNFAGARDYFSKSLALREHAEVRAALDSLP